jgi:hypothetical protein
MMTPRPLARTRRAAIGLTISAAGFLTLAGCDPRTLLYFLQPFEPTIAPEGPSLKGKKVVVLTHASSGTQSDFRSLDRELTRQFVMNLREKVKKIDVVDPQKVWDWVDAHPSWSEPSEAAEAFEADIVIFLEIEEFRITDPSSPGLFKGMSKIHIAVTELAHPKNSKGKPMTDKPKEANVIYDAVRDTEFPSRGPMPMEAGISRAGFKNKFLKLVAMEVSWHFVERAHGDDIQDTKIYD